MHLMRSMVRFVVPERARLEVFKARRLGGRKYIRYSRLERAEGRKPAPREGEPFDIGGKYRIIPDRSTLNAITTHWVNYGHAIEELNAFKAVADDHKAFLDIGAAEGIFSAAFCALTGRRAWAFEPSPE